MEIEEPLINELLLVGAALGSTETFTAEDGSLVERFIRGENCLEWLQDLQRALRRDDEATRAVSVRLGSWRVVETKLLPLLLECRDDVELVVTLAKILVMLTMPLSPTARKWARFQVDARDAAEMGGTEAARRREAARAQVKHLLAMKRAFVQVAGGEAVAALVGAMEEPLARGARRTEADTLIIELVLTLFRNLLCIEDVCRGLAAAGGEEGQSALGGGDGVDDRLLHQELLVLLDREYVLEVVLCLCQGVQARENQPWNLLLMEIVFHLLRGYDAADVAAAGPPPPREGEEEDGDGMEENRDPVTRLPMTTPAPPGNKARGGNALSALLQQERLARAAVVQKTASRHSRFGGGLLLAGFDGKATRLVTNPFKDALASLPQARRKRTRRGAAVFASDGLMGAAGGGAHDLLEGGAGALLLPKGAPDPLTLRARKALHGFCRQLVEGGGYEPFMKSLKNEFRRDSSRLEPGDRIVFFRIVGFVLAFHRFLCLHASAAGKTGAGRPDWAGALIHSMDVLSFNLVLSTIDGLVAAKGFGDLVHAVALYKEMVGLLATLASSSNEAYRNIAVGLQHKLFYASEPVDKLHKVGACWKPGLFPRRFLADVLGLCEAQMRLLEANAAKAQDEEALKKEGNAVIRDMLAARKRFDLDRYFASLCTNQMVRMATHLLEQYLTNPPYVTLDVLTFFQRMRDFDLERRQQRHLGRKGDAPEEDEEAAGREKQTLEPMLFNVHTLGVLQAVLDDKRIAHEPRFTDLLAFAKSVVRHFGRMATRNPLLLVEALFQHPFPHTFCATLQQGYCQSHTLESVAVAAKGLTGTEGEEEGESAAKTKGKGKGQGKGNAPAAKKKGKKPRDDFIVSDSDSDEEADYEGEDESDEGSGGSGSSEGEEDAEEAAAAAAAQGIDPAAYAAQQQSQRLRRKAQKKEEARRRAAEEERRRLAALEEDSEDEWDGMLPAAPESGASSDSESSASGGKAKKKRDKPAKAPGAAARRRGAARWDIKEDATLRREYAKYKDSASCFYVLAAMGPLGEKGRTAEQVKRRLRFLKLLDPAAGAGKDKAGGKEKKQKNGSGSDSSSDSDSSSSSSSSSSESEGWKSRGSNREAAGSGSGSVASTSPAKSPARGEDGEGDETQKQDAPASASASAAAPSPAPAPAPAGRRRIRKKAAESSSESSDDAELDILG